VVSKEQVDAAIRIQCSWRQHIANKRQQAQSCENLGGVDKRFKLC
jgi:hypothetical protein